MWTSLVLLPVLGLAPGQGDLALTHVRATHGLLGPRRLNDTVYPGDILFVCFDIEGILTDDEGKARYSTALEVRDAGGKVLFRQKPENAEARLSLGGNRVPAYAQLSVGLDTPAGDYGFKVLVKDLASGREQSLSRTFKVLRRDFAVVRAAVSSDVDGQYPVASFACGQGVWVQFSAVGFERDGARKQPNVSFELRVLDEDGRAVTLKPLTNSVTRDVSDKQSGLPMGFPLSLNRPGRFTVELLASDQVGGKKAKLSFPIRVLPAEEER